MSKFNFSAQLAMRMRLTSPRIDFGSLTTSWALCAPSVSRAAPPMLPPTMDTVFARSFAGSGRRLARRSGAGRLNCGCVTPKAADDMVVNDARGLHPGIDDDRADELEPTLL